MVRILGNPIFQIIPPTTNVLARTFFIKSRLCGTAVLADYNGQSYLITSNHLITDPYSNNLQLKDASGWHGWTGSDLITRCKKNDIAIFKVPYINDQERLPLELDNFNLRMGQHVHFLGFPLMLEEYISFSGFENRPMPFERGAIVSMIGADMLILDGHSTVGFSGGPVVFFKENKHYLCGIIVGCKEEIRAVEMRDDDWQKELDAVYKENTGIIYAAHAANIRQLIDKAIGG